MIHALKARMKYIDRNFLLFLMAGIILGIGQSVDGSTLTNFLKERFNIAILQRSILVLPGEFPGFLVFIVIGFLYTLGDIRIAFVANILAALGMFLLGIVPDNYTLIILCFFIYGMGNHLYMPLSSSIGMSFASDGRLGRKLGQLNVANSIAVAIGSAILWLLFKFLKIDYTTSFTAGAVAFLASAVLLLCIDPGRTNERKRKHVIRKEYGLFYLLNILFGARKQIFITFGPWVLVDVFKQPVTRMTMLFFILSITGIFVKPLVGDLIDRKGEKLVLTIESASLFVICLGYAFADIILPGYWATILVCTCYVLDQTLTAANMARATYLKKIAVYEDDVSPALSFGLSIDHITSMAVAAVGGYIWFSSGAGGYRYIFIGGAFLAVLNFVFSRKIS